MQEHPEIYLCLCFLPEEKQPICHLWGEYFLLNFCIINSVILKPFQTPHFHLFGWRDKLSSIDLAVFAQSSLKSPWIPFVLEKSLDSCEKSLKTEVLFFLMLFGKWSESSFEQVKWKMQRTWWNKHFKSCQNGLGMCVLCNLWNYVPCRWSVKCPGKSLKKWLQIFVWTLSCFSCSSFKTFKAMLHGTIRNDDF